VKGRRGRPTRQDERDVAPKNVPSLVFLVVGDCRRSKQGLSVSGGERRRIDGALVLRKG